LLVTGTVSGGPADITDIEKSAMVMMLVGQETAAQVVKFLSQPEINRLSLAMSRMAAVPRHTAAAVLREFSDLMRQGDSFGMTGGEAYLRGVLEKALGSDKAERILGRLKQGVYSAGLEEVKWQDPRDLAEAAKTEHPQIVAMIAAYLEPEQAQMLMQHLPNELVEQVIPRLAMLDGLPSSAIEELSESLENLLTAEPRQARLSVGGIDIAAKILGRLGNERADQILETIRTVDPDLAEQLNERMFVFEDLFEIDDRSFQMLLRTIDQRLLIVALKGAANRCQDKVLRNMSQRASQMLREELDARGPVRQADIDEARKQILAGALALERDGKIILREATDLIS
jgi:flagellar motor switch protein FliG